MEPADIYQKSSELAGAFRETLTFQSRQSGSPPTFVTYTVANCLRAVISDTELLARQLLSVTTRRWHIPQLDLDNANDAEGNDAQAPRPKPDDQFIDQSGVTWIVNDGGVETTEYDGQTVDHVCLCSKAVS